MCLICPCVQPNHRHGFTAHGAIQCAAGFPVSATRRHSAPLAGASARSHDRDYPAHQTRRSLGGLRCRRRAPLQASGSLGDTLWANQVGPYFPLATANATRQLDDLAKRDKYDLGQHLPAAIEQLRWKGRLHGMPWLVHAGWSGFFVNEDAWSRAGQPVPTWDWTYQNEFLAATRRITRQTGDPTDVFGIEVPFNMQAALTFLRSWGTDLLSPDGTKSLLNQPKAIEALTFAHDLMNVQKVAPTSRWPTPSRPASRSPG